MVKESTREKISKSRVGIVFSKKQREKLSKARRGTKLSESAKKAISGKNSITARKVIDPNGVEYDTVRLCAEAYGVKDNTVRKWIKNPNKEFSYSNDISGKSFYESISRKVIGPDGTIYPSLVKCAKAIGRTKGTVKRWIEKFPEKGFKYYTKDK